MDAHVALRKKRVREIDVPYMTLEWKNAIRRKRYTMPGLGMNFLFFFLSTPEQRTIFSVKKKRHAIIYI